MAKNAKQATTIREVKYFMLNSVAKTIVTTERAAQSPMTVQMTNTSKSGLCRSSYRLLATRMLTKAIYPAPSDKLTILRP